MALEDCPDISTHFRDLRKRIKCGNIVKAKTQMPFDNGVLNMCGGIGYDVFMDAVVFESVGTRFWFTFS